jgi:DNA-binding LacI/PurR family transcriptional regulator
MNSVRREQGFKFALKKHAVKEFFVEYGDLSRESGYAISEKMFSSSLIPTAIFFVNDDMAIGSIRYFNKNKINVPDDVSVVGSDGIDIGCYLTPTLTTVSQPLYEIGKIGVERIFSVISGKVKTIKEILEPELIIRESTKKVREG